MCLGVKWDHSCHTEWEHQRWFRFRLDLFYSQSHCGTLWETYPSKVSVSCKKTQISFLSWLGWRSTWAWCNSVEASMYGRICPWNVLRTLCPPRPCNPPPRPFFFPPFEKCNRTRELMRLIIISLVSDWDISSLIRSPYTCFVFYSCAHSSVKCLIYSEEWKNEMV